MNLLTGTTDGVVESFSRKLTNVYPLYTLGWESRFQRLYERLQSVGNLYSIGRSGLFLHCNMDHCMLMGARLATFIRNGAQPRSAWEAFAQQFRYYRVRN